MSGEGEGRTEDGTPGQGTFDEMTEPWQEELCGLADKVTANKLSAEELGKDNAKHLQAMLKVMKANDVPSFSRNGHSFTRREIERVEAKKASSRA